METTLDPRLFNTILLMATLVQVLVLIVRLNAHREEVKQAPEGEKPRPAAPVITSAWITFVLVLGLGLNTLTGISPLPLVTGMVVLVIPALLADALLGLRSQRRNS